jgi:hypothetical protein
MRPKILHLTSTYSGPVILAMVGRKMYDLIPPCIGHLAMFIYLSMSYKLRFESVSANAVPLLFN